MRNRGLQHFKSLLLKERSKAMDTLELMDKNNFNTSLRDSIEELSTYDNHPADIATETFQMEESMALKQNQRFVIQRIDDALKRINDGTYGVCQRCGKAIDGSRLEILPYAELCISCQQNDQPDIEELHHDRPVEEQLLGSYYGYGVADRDDRIGFDGEDSWQAVARYNQVPNDPSYSTGDQQGIFDENDEGIVQQVDKTINEDYEEQLSEEGNDIPDR
ncbi:TraR/DksA C4-type zinc finger protein [Mahella sp.]|jgi:YteA family regulatory protein|uniref:TraR/DksA C4-type zinc finger protein n=1 Tax=Mahella sp. TaxID=2798721 RepID=UPI0025C14B1A|nr:TraR/DksA C4-type zinc finger protein [Mahella sp.]MBZ4666746.1 transcriptional regulator, TraR/DksA family [Mahella sp.]